MPVSTQIDTMHGVIIRTVLGSLSTDEFLTELDKDFERPNFRPGLHTLWDFTGADPSLFDATDLKQLIAGIDKRMEGRGTEFKSAILVTADVDFGIARMYEVYADDLPIKRRIFREPDIAWEWLTETEE